MPHLAGIHYSSQTIFSIAYRQLTAEKLTAIVELALTKSALKKVGIYTIKY